MFAVTPRKRLGLQPDLDVAHVLGLDGRRGEDRPVQRVGRHAVQVEADRLEAGRIGRIGVDARRRPCRPAVI